MSGCAKSASDVIKLLQCSIDLPFDMEENTVIELQNNPDGFLGDAIVAPRSISSISATDVFLTSMSIRVLPGRAALFKLAPIDANISVHFHKHVLRSLACVTQARTLLCTRNKQTAADLSIYVERGCVFLAVDVPLDTPAGSFVQIDQVCVARCAVVLADAPLSTRIDFNHAPACAGEMMAGAAAGDDARTAAALLDDRSTEEMDAASNTVKVEHNTRENAFILPL
jgi:hypothetical protein